MECSQQIKDVCGARVCIRYVDEIRDVVSGIIRPQLQAKGYGVDLSGDKILTDRDLLDKGDEAGYRGYHFYVRVPTVIDIFGKSAACLCEIQVRTPLQDVWAEQSRHMLYSQTDGFLPDEAQMEKARQMSNTFRAADFFFVELRDSVAESRGRKRVPLDGDTCSS